MTELNWQQMATGVGDFLAVGMLVVVFKAVVGVYWTDIVNRAATLILATLIPVLATLALGSATWETLVLAAFMGVIVAGSLLGVNAVYRSRVDAEHRGLPFHSPL